MMTSPGLIHRRDFLKFSAAALGSLLLHPNTLSAVETCAVEAGVTHLLLLGRVTRRSLNVYGQPDTSSKVLRRLGRDQIVALLEEIVSPSGPPDNSRWYRLEHGFIHSAYVQRIENPHLNQPLTWLPPAGQLGQVSVPLTQSIHYNRKGQWIDLYRLYYGSVHWITAIEVDREGQAWYDLTDEWLKIVYRVPAGHVRPLPAVEVSPIAAEIPATEKRIEVSLESQFLEAYQEEELVYQAPVASGRRWMETPRGEFTINRKAPSKHMGYGALTSEVDAYELVGVPWVCFFHTNGVAFHGTYWHDNFSTPMSHGCINLRTADALWLFRWCTPLYDPTIRDRKGWKVRGEGTAVRIY